MDWWAIFKFVMISLTFIVVLICIVSARPSGSWSPPAPMPSVPPPPRKPDAATGQRAAYRKEDMNDETIEKEIQAKGLTAPRVTLAGLKANIVTVEFVKHVAPSGQVLRWAVITTRSGYAVTGRPSVSVSPENDNAELGEKIAVDNACDELWPLMGYALKERLAREPVATVTNNNQSGWLNIVETKPNVTLNLGTKLYL